MLNQTKHQGKQCSLLTSRQTAAYLNISERSLWSHTVPRGDIPCVRIGTAVRYDQASLEHWVRKQIENQSEIEL